MKQLHITSSCWCVPNIITYSVSVTTRSIKSTAYSQHIYKYIINFDHVNLLFPLTKSEYFSYVSNISSYDTEKWKKSCQFVSLKIWSNAKCNIFHFYELFQLNIKSIATVIKRKNAACILNVCVLKHGSSSFCGLKLKRISHKIFMCSG